MVVMSRWKEVRKEYASQEETSSNALAEAQINVRLCYGGSEYDTRTQLYRRFARTGHSMCPCMEPTHYTVATYDDWGDGPQCTMCGRIKEGEDE